MARQRKDLTINKDLLKKASAVEPTIDATQKQDSAYFGAFRPPISGLYDR